MLGARGREEEGEGEGERGERGEGPDVDGCEPGRLREGVGGGFGAWEGEQ